MNNVETNAYGVSPVWQFVSLLAPTVLTGFYLVYALVGLFIEGRSLLKWSDEALTVGLRVTLLVVILNSVVMAYAYSRRLPKTHMLWVSPVTHILIAVLLTLLIAFIT